MRPRILVASPVNQKPAILAYFLFSLRSLRCEEFDVHFMFADDNTEESSSALLEQFRAERGSTLIVTSERKEDYSRDEVTHYWNERLIDKVAGMKDDMIRHALEQGYDALFLIDSDLMFYPDTLLRLWTTNKDIISNIFWTRWQKDYVELPQVWLMDEYLFYRPQLEQSGEMKAGQQMLQFLEKMRVPGVYEVGGLGACTLIRRNALHKGVCFKRLFNVSFRGEDRHFCIRAAALGIPLFVDTRYPAYHIYRESELEGAKKFQSGL